MYDDEANFVKVSVVVIGLNEESRLRSCLESIVKSELKPEEIIYVDSGSTDRSVEIAKSVPGVRVFALDTNTPSPGMGRNVGLSRCRGDYVQFVDGDMLLSPDWLGKGINIIRSSDKICCVCGLVMEEKENINFIEDLISIGWETKPIGDVVLSGGCALFRREILVKLGGYRNYLVAEEESELGERIINSGYRTVRVPIPMCKHKLEIKELRQYLNRIKRSGMAHMQILKTVPSRRKWEIFKSPVYSICALLLLLLPIIFNNGSLVLLLILLYFLLNLRIGYKFFKNSGNLRRSILQGLLNYPSMLQVTYGFFYELCCPRIKTINKEIFFNELSSGNTLVKKSIPNIDIQLGRRTQIIR